MLNNGFLANLALLISSMLEPFMPETSAEIARQLKSKPIQLPKSWGFGAGGSARFNYLQHIEENRREDLVSSTMIGGATCGSY